MHNPKLTLETDMRVVLFHEIQVCNNRRFITVRCYYKIIIQSTTGQLVFLPIPLSQYAIWYTES